MRAAHRQTPQAAEGHAATQGLGPGYRLLRVLSRLRRLPPRAARRVLVCALPLLWLAAGQVGAQGGPDWQVGYLSARGDASWWYAEVADGIAPEVWADWGEAGVNYWSYCPAPILQPQTCIVVAQGDWTVVKLGGRDGEVLHERGRVYLPGVSR